MQQRRADRSAGFTLVEVIVTLVVLAIVAAIAIPSLTGWIDESHEKICAANRASLLENFQASLALDRTYLSTASDGDFQSFLNRSDLSGKLKCPSGGAYGFNGVLVTCSVHSENYFQQLDNTDRTLSDLFATLPSFLDSMLDGTVNTKVITLGLYGELNFGKKANGDTTMTVLQRLLEKYGVSVTSTPFPSSMVIYLGDGSVQLGNGTAGGTTLSSDTSVASIVYKSGSSWIVTYPNGSSYSLGNIWGDKGTSGHRGDYVHSQQYLDDYIAQNGEDANVKKLS